MAVMAQLSIMGAAATRASTGSTRGAPYGPSTVGVPSDLLIRTSGRWEWNLVTSHARCTVDVRWCLRS